MDNTITNLTYADNEPGKNNPDLIYDIERYRGNHSNTDKRSYKLLGVYLDKNLSFDYHTKVLCNKLNRSLFCINRVKNLLSPKALITLHYALVHFHLSYGPIILSCAFNTNIQKITKIQKKAIQIISNKPSGEHTVPLLKKLRILSYDLLIQQAKLKFMHAITYNYAPSSFAKYEQKS